MYEITKILAVPRRSEQMLGFLDVHCVYLTSKKVICLAPD